MLCCKLKVALPFAYRIGLINPYRVLNLGLVYDVSLQDYINLLHSFNYTKKLISLFTRSSTYNCTSTGPLKYFDLNYLAFVVFVTEILWGQ